MAARNNPKWLIRCIKSFIDLAKYPYENEIIVMLDYDDHNNIDALKDPVFFNPNIHTIIRAQSGIFQKFCMSQYYINHGALYSTGKYVWSVGSDCQVETVHWDDILKKNIEQYLLDKPDRIAYIVINDDTHMDNPNVETDKIYKDGCCFPLLTRESVNAIGGLLPKEVTFWGADIMLYNIFKLLPSDRILWCQDKVKILHESIHNNKISPENGASTHTRCNKLSYVSGLTPNQLFEYRQKICYAILYHQCKQYYNIK